MKRKLDALRDYIGEARAILLNFLRGKGEFNDLSIVIKYLTRAYDIVDELLKEV